MQKVVWLKGGAIVVLFSAIFGVVSHTKNAVFYISGEGAKCTGLSKAQRVVEEEGEREIDEPS